MLNGIKKCINIYHARVLTVERLNVDNEFACIKEDVLPMWLNIVAVEEHMGDVEISVMTVKEGVHCQVHRLPYEHYTKLMVTGCVINSVKDLNQLPSPNGMSHEISSSTTITGK